MATFYFNSDSGESSKSQWTRHIQNKGYVDDLMKSFNNSSGRQTKDFSAIVSHQTKEINDTIHSASNEQIAAIQNSTSAICGTLESGFDLLSDNLQDISYSINDLRSEINAMAAMLDWKLSLLIEQQKITNLLLGNIAVLLRIPDIQKERQYYIEQGMKFLKNAIFDSDFYDDSLNNLLKAEKIEPTDYFVLHRIGLIYMYSPKHLELIKAEEYFRKAIKYSVAESFTGASLSNNLLANDVNEDLLSQGPTVETIKVQAAESYLFASRSCYIQGKLNEAVDFAGKGYILVPQFVEAGFTLAKALAANKNETQAAVVLEKVINADRYYSLKALSDFDLCTKPSIQTLLVKLQREASEKAKSILLDCKKKIISGSNSSEYLQKIEHLINRNNYLASKKAIDLFDVVMEWNYCEPFRNPDQTKYLNEIVTVVNQLSTIKYFLTENGFIPMNSNFINNFIRKINQETQWTLPFYELIRNNSNWTNSIKSNSGNYTVLNLLEVERVFNDDLPNIVSKINNLHQKYIEENNQHIFYLNKVDKENLSSAIGSGVLSGLGGLGVGLIAGIVFIIFNYIGTCVFTGHGSDLGNHPDDHSGNIVIGVIMVIAGIIGAIIGFNSKRKKK